MSIVGCLARLECFLLDMDGTIYLGNSPLEGAPDFIAYLQESGRRFLFLTNNPTADKHAYARKLAGMGIRVGPDAVLTSVSAS